MSPSAASPLEHTTFRRRWWRPLGFVVATLAVLAVAPFVTSARVRARREALTEQVDPARVLVNDVETALATQMYALGELAQRNPAERADAVARYRAARASQGASEVTLDSLAQRLGPDVTERFVELRTLAAEWHQAAPLPRADSGVVEARSGAASANALALARATMDAADRLERVLDALSTERRADIRAVERWDRRLPLVLVPLAVLSVGIVLRTGDRLVRLAVAADEGRRTLAEAAAAREALLRGVTHDVKNPLGAALGYAELLEDGVLGPVSDGQRDVAARLRRLMQGALATVTDLLELSRAEAGPLPVTPVVVDLAGVVRDAATDYEAAARAADLRLETTGTDAPLLVTTDPARVRQVLGNLLSNAIKYTPGGGAVRVALSADAGQARVSVHDTGPGIPAALRDRVFDEFFRVPESAHVTAGTGVGLAIARHVARRLGGDLTLADAGPPGACFVLELPLDQGPR